MGVYEYNMGSWRYFHKLHTSIRPRGVSDMTENLAKKLLDPLGTGVVFYIRYVSPLLVIFLKFPFKYI